MLASVVKWTVIAIFIGCSVGFVNSLFIKIVSAGCQFSSRWKYFYFLLPFALFASSYIVMKMAPDAKGHGTEKAIEAVNRNDGNIDIKVVPVKLISTFITVVSGGSVGLEGPATQVGAGIASFFGRLCKMDNLDKRKMVVCGISAGFVTVFPAPAGAALFGTEVLFVGKISYMSLLPSLVASFSSFYIAHFMGVKPLIYSIKYIPSNNAGPLFRLFLFGLIIGVLALFFIKMVNYTENAFKKLHIYPPLKGIIGGILIAVIVYMIGSNDYIGIGEQVINRAMSGEKILNGAFLLKMFNTSVTLGSGGSGGILTPMLFIGASAGNTWAQLINGNVSFYSAVGMVAFLSACSNTPISAIIIAMELFGNSIGIYAAIVCGISYFVVGCHSIYPTQLLMFSKSPSLQVAKNCEIDEIKNIKVVKSYKYFKDLICKVWGIKKSIQ